LEADSIRPVVLGYDRLVAIGDMDVSWDDYEVAVPITIHGINPAVTWQSPGVGILMRWDGHYDWVGGQPTIGWYPMGALGWYRWRDDTLGDRLMMIGNHGTLIAEDTSGRKLAYDVRYIFKMRVETIPDQGGLYSLKVWEEGQPEPSEWDLVAQERLSDPQNGSLLLLTHHVDASFGDVTVVPSPFNQAKYTLRVNVVGDGGVTVEPDQAAYQYGDVVTLTVTADPGWSFDVWSGDLSGSDNPETITMYKNRTVTATFTQDEHQIFLPLITIQGSP